MTASAYRILLIEDNPGDVRLIHECLRAQGIDYQLTHCETVDSAIQRVRAYGLEGEDVPDLILLDYNLPRGEARTVISAAMENPVLGATPKAVVTSSVSPRDKQEALRNGADCFIYKPADLDAFLTEVGGKIAELLATRKPSR